jgi:hypothetical protein
MRRFLFTAFLMTALDGSALEATTNRRIALTVIPRALTVDCYVSLNSNGRPVVGYLFGQGWRFGINGRVYTFYQRDSVFDRRTGAYTARTRDGSASVRTVWIANEADAINIEVRVNGSMRLFRGYKFCAAGD